ncbi:MAG TPA: ATP-binding protein [Blastocatellia bacterium]|jgi:PAS domain S-box-containing protein|nr:ATP-binding protein [Blastocatellia bacterium]
MFERQTQPGQERSDSKRGIRRRLRIALLAVATILLFTLLFAQEKWVQPDSANEAWVLYALSIIIFLAFVVLLMLLVRNIIKLRRDRREMKHGAKFKTRLVTYFISLSLLPVIFLFLATSSLINRSFEKWFGSATNQIVLNALEIEKAYNKSERLGVAREAVTLARLLASGPDEDMPSMLAAECENQGLFLAQLYDQSGRLVTERSQMRFESFSEEFRDKWLKARTEAFRGVVFSVEAGQGAEKPMSLIAGAPVAAGRGVVVIAQEVSPEISERIKTIKLFEGDHDRLKGKQRLQKNIAFITLGLITLLVLFIAFWLALSVARSIADPVQQLAQATERIKSGDLTYRAGVIGDDELAALARSFNEMTAELSENRRRLEQSASELQMINSALEERRRYIETVMQSLSAGVVSLDENRGVTMINEAARRLLRVEPDKTAGTALESLLPETHREEFRRMILRAAPRRPVTQEIHFTFADQSKVDAGVTVTALDNPRGGSRGAVIVIEDLTELIEAQRRAAWSEVARRMAHEIKNPLTPIKLSAERLAKNLLDSRNAGNGKSGHLSERQTELVRQCTAMIGAEVATLQRMVDEFSNFARLPKAAMETASLNEVVVNSLKLYDERLNGIRLTTSLAPHLPGVMIDREQVKRALVNLIDNAAEAMAEVGGDRRITVITREVPERESLELIVADTGPGIPPEDRERIFDPYFSTRKRGTGLGLAIVSRIVVEHQGRIRVQENLPRGARFIIELPVAEQAVARQILAHALGRTD